MALKGGRVIPVGENVKGGPTARWLRERLVPAAVQGELLAAGRAMRQESRRFQELVKELGRHKKAVGGRRAAAGLSVGQRRHDEARAPHGNQALRRRRDRRVANSRRRPESGRCGRKPLTTWSQRAKWTLFGNNCEHWARWVVRGEQRSTQIDGLAVVGLLVLIACQAKGA
jgi:hypothetical protein